MMVNLVASKKDARVFRTVPECYAWMDANPSKKVKFRPVKMGNSLDWHMEVTDRTGGAALGYVASID